MLAHLLGMLWLHSLAALCGPFQGTLPHMPSSFGALYHGTRATCGPHLQALEPLSGMTDCRAAWL